MMGIQTEILHELHEQALAELKKAQADRLQDLSYLHGVIDGITQARKALMLPSEPLIGVEVWEGAHI